MGYLHINNLYKEQLILLFRECYAMEKIHGTSAHITFKSNPSNLAQRQLVFFAGGESHNNFVALFDREKLFNELAQIGVDADKDITIYGEAYGGKQQGMSATYGTKLRFIAFDVQIGDYWLDVPKAEDFVKKLGLEFVHYEKVSTELKDLDYQRDLPSVQSVRNGVITTEQFSAAANDHNLCKQLKVVREGVVLRPLVEVALSNGNRVICKHKGDDFKETATPRPVVDPAKITVLDDAEKIADEWVTPMRLEHVLDKLPGHSMERMRDIIFMMQEDVLREAAGEIVESEAVKKAIGKKAVVLYKQFLTSKLNS